jgi:uncharacterized membrane protein (Fun14 family)
MVTEAAFQPIYQLVATMGGSGILGFMTGYAIKKVLRIVIIIGGLVAALLGYLEWKNMITVNWNVVSHETYTAANSTIQTVQGIAEHVNDKVSGIDSGVTIGIGGTMFFVSFLYGLKKG